GPQPISAGDLGGNADVLEHGEFGENLGNLESPGHPERDALMRRQSGDVAAVEADGAGGRREKSADQVEEGGLAGAVRPDDRAQFALRHIERNLAHRDEIAEALGDVVDFEHVHALLRCRKPSNPRGKNSTTRTNSSPTNDIQL